MSLIERPEAWRQEHAEAKIRSGDGPIGPKCQTISSEGVAMPSWDPQQYGRFSDHRLRPGLDLLARIGDLPQGPIYDLGCGAGALSPLIAARWPDRPVIGIDNSAEMLATAREAAPEIEFLPGDIADWHPATPAALLFANASLQWLDGHDALFARLMKLLLPGGVLAVQMPRNHESPSHRLM